MTSEQRILHGRYRLDCQLGAGGMGTVWRAKDTVLGRIVALKELVPNIQPADLAERRARAEREARTLAKVKHPAIVNIYDIFWADGDPWIVMEYINGTSLAHIIRLGPLREPEMARIGLPVLRGLRAAHQAGVVHRDVKPANIVVKPANAAAANDESVFLVDFGIAKVSGEGTLTDQSKVVGTPDFLAPEQILGRAVQPATDLWSLGVTLFCALEGFSPFLRRGDSPVTATMMAIVNDDPPRLTRPGRLAAVVLRLLQKEPSDRAGADEVIAILESILVRRPDPPKTPHLNRPRPTHPVAPQPKPARRGVPRLVPDPSPALRAPPPRPQTHPVEALTGRRLLEARQRVQDAGPDAGAVVLLAMSDHHAAKVLAACLAKDAGALLEAMARTRPQAAGAILQILLATAAGRAVSQMTPRAAASVLRSMPAGEAVRILGQTDLRTVAAVITELPSVISDRLIRLMSGNRAASVLEYVAPVVVATVLTASGEPNQTLLAQLDPLFRVQVRRYLPPTG
jgi:serine/threonine protein kinase